MKDFEIYKTLVASTMHVTPEDFDLLRGWGNVSLTAFGTKDFVYHEQEYGIRVFVKFDEITDRIGKYSFSEGFKALIIFAISNDCRYLELDADGYEYDGFPLYSDEWDARETEDREEGKNDWDCTTQGEWA